MILPIYVYGQPVLRKVAEDIAPDYPNLKELIENMFETMDNAEGVGLAAPQVGFCRRFFIMHLEDEQVEAINPVILKTSGKQYVLEGCLSCPNKWGYVTRPKKCKLRAQDRNGNWFEKTFTELGAQCVCHETAHLDGQLFVDVVEEFVQPEEVK